MKHIILSAFVCLLPIFLQAQNEPYYIQQFDAAEGNTLCIGPDSNLWIGCVRNRQPLLLKVTRGGILLEQFALDFSFGQYNPPSDLIVDSEGMLVGCGVMFPVIPSDYESSYVFRYDPVARQLLWSRRIAHTFFFARGILEREPGSDYTLYGRDYALASTTEILTIHRQTGDIIPSTSFTYKMGREEDIDAVILHQGDLYATGRNDLGYLTSTYINNFVRQGLWKIGANGSPQWALVGSVPNIEKSNLVGRDLLIEDNAIYSLSSGNDQSALSNPSNLFLQKTSLDGTPLWIRKYDITNFNFNSELGGNLISVPDGFIIFGKSNRDFLLKTDKDGNLIWAQRLPTVSAGNWQYRPRRHIAFDGEAILVISTLRDNPTQSRAVLLRIDLNGNIAGCNRLSPLNAEEIPLNNPFFTNLPLQVSPHGAQSLATPTTIPEPAPTALALICQNEGPALSNPCLPATFLKKIDGSSPASRPVALAAGTGDTLYVALQNGLIAALDGDGKLLWSLQLEVAGGDTLRVSDLILDSDGMLAGRGRLGNAALACRIDPVTRQILWMQTIPTIPFEGGGILELAPGEAFLLHHNLQLPDGRKVPETFQLDRNTGALLALSGRRYDFDTGNQTQLALALNSNQLYAAGRYQTAAGPRLGVSRLDANFGGPVWSKWSHTAAVDPGSSGGGAASLYDEDHLIVAYTGSNSNAAQPFGGLFMQKTDPQGNILWVRSYDLPILGELDIATVPGAYVMLGKTGAGAYVLLKTDRNGNLLLSKNITFGAGAANTVNLQGSRLVFQNDYLWATLYDERPGQESAWLLKTDLNLESAGPCGFLSPLAATPAKTVLNPVATSVSLPVLVTPLGNQPVVATAPDAALSFQQICPPVYVEPTLSLGPDRNICSLDTALLISNAGFKDHQWQDGLLSPSYSATTAGSYWVQAFTLCNNLQSDTAIVQVTPHPTLTDTIAAAAGVPVLVNNTPYFAPDTVTVRIPSVTGFCDTLHTYYIVACATVQTVRTIQFYPGQTVQLDGFSYNQPGVHTHTLQTVFGCDSLVTYFLEWLLTDLALQCPANMMETAEDGQNTLSVQYSIPTFSTNCTELGNSLSRISGPASGSNFPVGTTEVCYQACNGCGICDTCCFTVTVLPSQTSCDVKEPGGCIRYELVAIYLESNGSKRYRMRIVNNCAVPLDYVTFQLPNGITAQWPANNSYYTAPSGNTYLVRNPNFNSIRFKISGGALTNGAADLFEYVLPPQAEPAYILATARLNDGSRTSTHLSALGCPPVPWPGNGNREAPYESQRVFRLLPNPATDLIVLEFPVQYENMEWSIVISDINGRVMQSRALRHDDETLVKEDVSALPTGLYHCKLQSEAGSWTARFVVLR